jgi:hypothetical protein
MRSYEIRNILRSKPRIWLRVRVQPSGCLLASDAQMILAVDMTLYCAALRMSPVPFDKHINCGVLG